MVHDFNVTRNYVIFMDLPAVWNFEGMAENGLPIVWDESYGARLGVMPRNGTNADVTWYEIDPCYVFHPLNAYESGSDLILDVCRMDDTMKPGSSSEPKLTRWTIKTVEGRVEEVQLDDRMVDFPRVADNAERDWQSRSWSAVALPLWSITREGIRSDRRAEPTEH